MPFWRNVICKGCPIGCRYRDLRGSGITFVEIYEVVLKRSREEAATGNYKLRTNRSRILGQMHEQKLRIWEHTVTNCPERIDGNPLWDAVDDIRRPRVKKLPLRIESLLVAMGDEPTSVADAAEMLLCSRGAAHKTLSRLAKARLVLKLGHDQYQVPGSEVPF